MNIKVTADSTCDLSQELLDRYNISTVPLHIIKGEKQYDDLIDITPSDIIEHVSAGGDICGTTAVNTSEYVELFEEFSAKYDAVFHITISAEFSSCYQNACTAAEGFSNVYVIDSRNLSTGQGLVVIEAAIKGKTMESPEQLHDYLMRLTDRVEASFVVNSLEYIRKGGRCSAVAHLGANLLQLKVCIRVNKGKMDVVKKYRGSFTKCLNGYIEERIHKRDDISTERIFITHSFCDDYVDYVRGEIDKHAVFDEILVTRAGCTVTCHCGPGTLGILFIRKD